MYQYVRQYTKGDIIIVIKIDLNDSREYFINDPTAIALCVTQSKIRYYCHSCSRENENII